MAFGVGLHPPRADAGSVRGMQKEIACECWFTSTGKVMPLMLKKIGRASCRERVCMFV